MTLASIIAAAGVVADSTATVIGAMIVAPLMTPILGTVLAVTTDDRPGLQRSLLLLVGGAGLAVAIGVAIGLLDDVPVVAATNSQVDTRVAPRLIDLVAALATGVVGAFAQCREDIADALPGVAIAISLVPPLVVVGLTLESGAPSESWGAALLFLTNVAAILLSGLVVMAIFGVRGAAARVGFPARRRRLGPVVIGAMVAALVVPLAATSIRVTEEALLRSSASDAATEWAERSGWDVASVRVEGRDVEVVVLGDGRRPDPRVLARELDRTENASLDLRVRFVPQTVVELPGS